jgi:hypothetical protein
MGRETKSVASSFIIVEATHGRWEIVSRIDHRVWVRNVSITILSMCTWY